MQGFIFKMARTDSTLPEELRKDGYSLEEKYFDELNRELLNDLHRKQQALRSTRNDLSQASNTTDRKKGGRLSRILHKLFPCEGSQDLF